MTHSRKNKLARQFKKAGSTGTKMHVMARKGKWAYFKEGEDRVKGEFVSREDAIQAAETFIVGTQQSNMLVLHKEDGTVDQLKSF